MKGDKMTCPTCGRQVGFYRIRDPRVSHGRPIPAIRKPYQHQQPPDAEGDKVWCPAGEP